jgi:hypothetical protein
MKRKTRQKGAYIFVSEMLEQLQFSIRPLSEHRRAEGLHNLLDSNILVGELVPRRAIFGGGGEESQISMDAISQQAKKERKKGPRGRKTRKNLPHKTKRSHAHGLEV